MGFDSAGLWHEEVYKQPQTGAMGALNILNQLQSYGNSQKAQARQSEADIANQATEGEKHGQDFSQYPEYQNANDTLGISQDTAQGIFGNIPQQKLKAALAAAQAANGSDPLSPEQVAQVYLGQGATPPTSYLSSSAKKDAADERAETAFNSQASKQQQTAEKAAWDSGLATQKEARQAGIDALRAYHGVANRDIPDGAEERWAAYVASGSDQKNPKATAQIGATNSRSDLYNSEEEKNKAMTDQINALTDPKAKELSARTNLEDARLTEIQALTKLKQMQVAGGGLTTAGIRSTIVSADSIDSKIAAANSPLAAQLGGTPQERAAAVIQHMQAADTLRKLIGQPPKYDTSPAGQAALLQKLGGAPAAAPTDTAESIAADYKAGKITREQAAAKLKALGHPGS